MRIAVIGAGVSGLVSAYLLNRAHEVELFEQRATAGGHANTVMTEGQDGQPLALDVGFTVYSERTYPWFGRLLRELAVDTQPSEMSFSVRIDEIDFEFSSRGLRGYLAQPRNAVSLQYLRMGLDLLRFQREGRQALEQPRDAQAPEISFDEYLDLRGYGRHVRERVILPLIASTWSNAPTDVLGFPAYYLLRFLAQHGVLARNSIPEWRWIQGGARTYVQRVLDTLPPAGLHLDEPIAGVRRTEDGVRIDLRRGGTRAFDALVLACHADQALSLLQDASQEERSALGAFTYTTNHVALHTDERVLPRNHSARAAWNYRLAGPPGVPEQLTMSYDLNRLQRIGGSTRYCVSVNPSEDLDPRKVLASFEYSHPVFSLQTLEAQRRLDAVQGLRNTHYAGAHLGFGFHEDGAASGVRVAARLGVQW